MSERWVSRSGVILAAVTLLGAALRFWRLGATSLLGDESYYWLWSSHLDWAFIDHPAGVAIQTWLSTRLGGQSEAGIRWLNALLGVSGIPLAYLVGKRILSERAGLLAACTLATGAPFVLVSRFVYTDALQLALLLTNLFFFWQLVGEMPQPRLASALAFGLSLGLLFNTKYSAYLYALGLSLAIVLDHRWLLGRKRFWLGCLIAGLGLLPVLVWNAAHDWASFLWQLQHARLRLGDSAGLIRRLAHAVTYLSWPLIALALLGLGRFQRKNERLLGLVAASLFLPVILSPVDSPRNLLGGLMPLLLLAGERWSHRPQHSHYRGIASLLGALAFLYGLGTVVSLSGVTGWPHSSALANIRQDAAGWRRLGPELVTYPKPLFALDYSAASQAWYYSRQPAYTAWEQYRLWGIPDLSDVTVVSLDYLPEHLLTERLENMYTQVEGPHHLRYEEAGVDKHVRIWQAKGLQIDQALLLDQLDFLDLWRAAQR